MFGYNGYQPQQQPAYGVYQQPQQMYQQPRTDFLQSVQPQPSGIQARPVTGREEAVAATVFPGSPMLFLDRAHGAVYYKSVDPQSNAVEFVDFIVPQPAPQQAAPKYVTVEMFESWRSEIEGRLTPPQQRRAAKGADAE